MSYASEGYEIVSALNPKFLQDMRAALTDALSRIGSRVIEGDLSQLIRQREAEDHDLVYKASNYVGSSLAAYRIVEAVSGEVERVTGFKDLHVMPVTISIQLPSDERFDYKWHQETAFYPWADNIINVWIPLQPTRVGTGTMSVIPKSQRGGLRNADQYFSHGSFRQIECAPTETEIESQVFMELDEGQYVIFDGDTVHRSDGNSGSAPRIVAIMRFIPSHSISVPRPLYKALSYEDAS
jgi:ectoine hydroxylase-related dioxygenase (phytanoyl-CoA dioxygenase family)